MMRTYIWFDVILISITFVRLYGNDDLKCASRTDSGKLKYVCCADQEEKGNACIPCSKGYTSIIGGNCSQCWHNTYGERCRYDCYCSDKEICDHVEGCVGPLSPTSTLEYEMSDTTTLPRNLETTSERDNINNSVQGLMSRETIIYIILSVLVMVFGIGFCFVSFKYMALTKQRKTTTSMTSIIQSQNPAIPQNGENIEMENRLYDIINETDMLDYQHVHQLEMSPAYLDVIDDSNIRASDEMNRSEKYENPCNLMSTAKTHIQENNVKVDCRSIMSGVSTSSCDEYHQNSTQDYLNPYQSMIQSEMSPPKVTEYLTLGPDNSRIESDMHNHQKNQKENSLQHLRNVEKNAMARTYENVLDVAYPSSRPI